MTMIAAGRPEDAAKSRLWTIALKAQLDPIRGETTDHVVIAAMRAASDVTGNGVDGDAR